MEIDTIFPNYGKISIPYANSNILNVSSLSYICNASLDITLFNFNEYDSPLTHTFRTFSLYDYIKIIICSITIVAVFIGNISVIIAVIHNRSLRTPINVYLANLAVADILICAFCIWVHLINNLTSPLYVLGPFMCKINGFAQMTCLTSSVLTLSAISCDRFVAIMCPLKVRIMKHRTSIVMIFIWIISLCVSTPFIIYREHYELQWRNFTEPNCIERWPTTTSYNNEKGECQTSYQFKKIYYTFVTVTLFFIPVIVMSTAYSLMVWKLWSNKVPGAEFNMAIFKAQHRAKKRVLTMVCVVLIAFVICWMPLQFIVLYSQFGHSTHDAGELPEWFPISSYVATFIAYSNSAFNPIIYGGFNKKFRDALYTLLIGCTCDKNRVSRLRRATVHYVPAVNGLQTRRGTAFTTQETPLTAGNCGGDVTINSNK